MKPASERFHIVRHELSALKIAQSLKKLGLGALFVLIVGVVLVVYLQAPIRAHAVTSSTLNFQARLTNLNGSTVSDGNYSVEFKIYNVASGGTAVWSETQPSVRAVNGYLTVNLGSVTAFPNTIDWSQEHWLTMNVAGDGEMLGSGGTRLKLTAVPYAFRAGQADTLTNGSSTLSASDLIQKTPASPQSLSSLLAAIRLDQTGAGGLLQLQGDGTDAFIVAKTGTLTSTGNATFQGGSLEIGKSTTAGNLALNDGSSNTGTLSLAALGSNRTYTFPDVSGTVLLDSTVGGSFFAQNGNSFTGLATLGTNDAFGLNLETDSQARLKITSGGNVGIGTTGDPSALFSVGTTSQFQVDAAGALATSGLATFSGGVSITGGIDNNAGGITEAGSITGVGANITATAGLIVASGGSSDLSLDSASNKLIIAADDTSVQRNAAGVYSVDLNNASTTTLRLINTDASNVADLNLADGSLYIAGTQVFTNGRGLQNLTGFSNNGAFATLGGTIDLNVSSNFDTNINTGSSTGTIILGGSFATLVIDSTAFDVSATGALSGITTIVTSGTINTNTFTGTNLTFGGASGTVSTTGNGNLTIGPAGSGVLALNTGSGGTLTSNASTIQRSGATGLTLDLANASNTTLTVTNSDASNVANLDVEGAIFAGSGNAFSVNSDGDITSAFTTLSGSSTTNGAAVVASTSMTLTNASNFDVGNYIKLDNNGAGCSGSVTICYAKITAKATNVLTITPALTWSTGRTVTEMHIPEIGGINTSQTLENRYGRGYFIAGVATGNGTTYYNENSIETSLTSFDLLNSGVTTLNIGGAATTINIGNASGTTTIAGSVSFSGNSIAPATGTSGYLSRSGTTLQPANSGDSYTTSGNISTTSTGTITAAAGLTVQGGGASITGNSTVTGTLGVSSALTVSAGGASIAGGLTLATGALNLSSGGITNAGSIAGASTLNLSGAITGATATNTINGLIINAGSLSGITGLTFTSGSLNLASGGITNVGSIAGVTTLSLTGAITGASATNTINGLIINAGALSGITTLNASGLATTVGLTAGTGLIQNTGGLTSIGTISLNANATTNVTNIGTGTTSGQVTIGGGTAPLVINSTAFDVSSTGALSGITTISMSGALTAAGLATFNGNIILETGDTFTINGDAFSDLTGNGLQITSGALNIDATTTGTTAVTGSNSGIEVTTDGLRLIGGCANNQILKWASAGAGAWNCAADATGISDERLKKNIETVEGEFLDRIKEVRIVEFDFDCEHPAFTQMHCDTDHQTGVIAQELAQIFPELVTEVNGYYQVRYDALALYNLKAVGQLAGRLENQPSQTGNEVKTGGTLRLDSTGKLQNITGLDVVSGGASVRGGVNNNGGGLTNTGLVSGITRLSGETINLIANATDNLLTLEKDGKGVFTVFNNGAVEIRLDGSNVFGVKNGSGRDYFSVNTSGALVSIGSNTADEEAILFVLDSKSTVGDPQGVNGAQYYNEAADKFRCFQDGRWQDCLPVTNSEYMLITERETWSQTVADEEFPGAPRSWVDLTNTRQFRLTLRLTSPGSEAAECRIQYALSDEGPWNNLSDSNTSRLDISKVGSLKTEWINIPEDARKEVLIRVMCKDGNFDSAASTGAQPVFNGLKLQLK